MNRTKRATLKTGRDLAALALVFATGLSQPGRAAAAEWNKAAFAGNNLTDVLRALGATTPAESKAIEMIAPEIAENGAIVPITINSKLSNTQKILLTVDRNPMLLAASFDIPAGTDPYIVTRVKMAETSMVNALVMADGNYYYASKEIKVTVGGCGG